VQHEEIVPPVERLVGRAIGPAELLNQVGLVQEGVQCRHHVADRVLRPRRVAAPVDEFLDVHQRLPAAPRGSPFLSMVPQGVLSSGMAKRSSSSTAVLALLGIDRWTPYELVQHMKRSTIHYIWPRAESKMYEELKRLAAAGHARAATDRRDPRRTRYTISAAGRQVLKRWIAEPGSGVYFESEGALKVLFAENGTTAQLLVTIDSMRAHALADLDSRARVFADVVRDGAPYPDRIHQSVLVFDLVDRLTRAVVEWADFAEARVRRWPSLAPDRRMRADAMQLIADLRDQAGAVVDAHEQAADDASQTTRAPSPRAAAL
jgi:DNA-binding PadR family transcriptional regulator